MNPVPLFLIIVSLPLLLGGCGEGSSIHKFMKQPNIHEAAAEGNIRRVKQHLVEGVNVNAKFKDGWTPLHMAAEGGHREIVDHNIPLYLSGYHFFVYPAFLVRLIFAIHFLHK